MVNSYVVGPGSQLDGCGKEWCDDCADPGGGYYRIAKDRPIASITADEFADLLRDDPNYQPERHGCEPEDGSLSLNESTISVGPAPEMGPDDVAAVETAIRDFQQASGTTPRAFQYVMDLVQGKYKKRGHGGDHSGAEVDLASKLYGILSWSETGELSNQKAGSLIYLYIENACNRKQSADDGSIRKWVKRGQRYREHVINHAIGSFDFELWERWQYKGSDTPDGEYSILTYQYLQRALHSVFEERPGYPSLKQILDASQALDPSRDRDTHEEAFRRLRTEHGQVKMAYLGGNEFVYYPTSAPDPPNAEYVQADGERYCP